MSEREKCGDFEIYKDESDGWWVVYDTKKKKRLGKFIDKNSALDKVAFFIQDEKSDEEESEYEETGSVC
ncbi:MAG: hypothetical protein ACTSVB_08655 [Candidatus Heimdallarchaeaceae archaeon]